MATESEIKKIFTDKNLAHWGYGQNLTGPYLDHYKKWIDSGLHRPLKYMENSVRNDLKLFFPEVNSYISILFPYNSNIQKFNSGYKLASFVTNFSGVDYHLEIGKTLKVIEQLIKGVDDQIKTKLSLDIHPVLERGLAYNAGLGWFGKNSMLINKKLGSYFMIGTILLSKKLNFTVKELESDHCGSCDRCIKSCPTEAIIDSERVIDSKKCISTFTIESFKDCSAPDGYSEENEFVFGCDHCQSVCPWNSKLQQSNYEKLSSDVVADLFNKSDSDIVEYLKSVSNREFRRQFKGTSLERTGKVGLLKNLLNYKP